MRSGPAGFGLYAKKEIKNLQDCCGKRFALPGIGSLPHVVILAILEQQKLDPEEIPMVAIGETAARLKALVAGPVGCTP